MPGSVHGAEHPISVFLHCVLGNFTCIVLVYFTGADVLIAMEASL